MHPHFFHRFLYGLHFKNQTQIANHTLNTIKKTATFTEKYLTILPSNIFSVSMKSKNWTQILFYATHQNKINKIFFYKMKSKKRGTNLNPLNFVMPLKCWSKTTQTLLKCCRNKSSQKCQNNNLKMLQQ